MPPSAVPKPAASILFLRDSTAGIEVFMVVRNAGLSFAASAMVFPGGKLVAGDHPDSMASAISTGHELNVAHSTHAVAALREAFEEAGLLHVKYPDGRWPDSDSIRALYGFRSAIDSGQSDFGACLRDAGLILTLDTVVPFAHIIGPTVAPKRFDTLFFIAPAPWGQTHKVDDHEIVEAHWITANAALALGDSEHRLLMSPTRLVLSRLKRYESVTEAIADAKANPPTPILPEVQTRDGIIGLYSPSAPGIDEYWEILDGRNAARRGLGGAQSIINSD